MSKDIDGHGEDETKLGRAKVDDLISPGSNPTPKKCFLGTSAFSGEENYDCAPVCRYRLWGFLQRVQQTLCLRGFLVLV